MVFSLHTIFTLIGNNESRGPLNTPIAEAQLSYIKEKGKLLANASQPCTIILLQQTHTTSRKLSWTKIGTWLGTVSVPFRWQCLQRKIIRGTLKGSQLHFTFSYSFSTMIFSVTMRCYEILPQRRPGIISFVFSLGQAPLYLLPLEKVLRHRIAFRKREKNEGRMSQDVSMRLIQRKKDHPGLPWWYKYIHACLIEWVK